MKTLSKEEERCIVGGVSYTEIADETINLNTVENCVCKYVNHISRAKNINSLKKSCKCDCTNYCSSTSTTIFSNNDNATLFKENGYE